MSLRTADKLGPYEILAPIGAGGMGEVYRARDPRLGRDVAIKISAEQFSERFEREARAVASLNHPNICHLYDVGPNYLVMELVEGEAPKGPLPLETVLEYARQIADALAAAHEKGIVHRDLKPANIKITPQGVVKVLDFGLAKIPERVSEGSPETSPTLSIHETKAGMILGTAAYMSPEQARGRPVDQRTDIWGFGCVLFEMLTGKRAFEGESISDTVASVLKSEPDWTLAPPKVQRLLRACLEKDPRKRLQAIGDYGLLLEAAPLVATTRSRTLPWIAAVAILTLIAAAGWLRPRPTTAPARNVEFSIHTGGPAGRPFISPDGSSVIYGGQVEGYYLRRLDSLQPRELRPPGAIISWSPDSRSIALIGINELQTMRVPESAPASIGPWVHMISRGGSWGEKGTILIAGVEEGRSGLYAHVARGGVTRVDVPGLKRGRYYSPQFLPGGEDLLFAFAPASSEDTEIYLARFDGRNISSPILLFKNDTPAQYTPAGGGQILFVHDDNLYAQKLDLKARKLVGDADLVAGNVASVPAFHDALFSISRGGEIAWWSGKAELSEIAVFSRQGKKLGTVGTPSPISDIRLSPDEIHFLGDSEAGAWLFERDQPGRLGLGSESFWRAWSPDGSRILGSGGGRVVERSVNGSGGVRELTHGDNLSIVTLDISSDGKVLLLSGTSAINSVRLDGSAGERAPKLLVQTDELVRYAKFSPDARWILYKAQPRNGAGGIYVQPFPGPGLRKQVASATFALSPVWRADGKKILYYDDNHIWSVRVDSASEDLRFSPPESLFSIRLPSNSVVVASTVLAVSRDGSRIYCLQSVEQPAADVINVRTGLWK